MGRVPVELGELVERWTLLEDERQLVAGKGGATRLGFALLLRFYACQGGFRPVAQSLRPRSWSSSPAS